MCSSRSHTLTSTPWICRSCTATTGGPGHPVVANDGIFVPGFGGGAVSCSRLVVLAPRANERDGGRASSPIRRVREIAHHSPIGRLSMRCVVAVVVRGHPCATRHPFRLAGLTALESLRKVGLLALNDGNDDKTSGKKSLLIIGGARGGWEAGRFPWRGRGIPPWRSRSRRPRRNESIRHEEIYRRGYHVIFRKVFVD